VAERELETSMESGLSPSEAAVRLSAYGLNTIRMKRGPSLVRIFISQFQDFMVLVLLGAVAASAYLGEYQDAAAILAIVLVNAVLGFVQEFRAERALAALKKLSAPGATVRRGGETIHIPAAEIVPGDVILLSAGDRVPADARLVDSSQLAVDESVLTGESRPVPKDHKAVARESAPVAERPNMVHAGTVVTRGRGRAIVSATGMDTEMGSIAGMMGEVTDAETPLQRRLGQLGRWLVLGCVLVCALVSALGVARGESLHLMFLSGVSLAVAAIPEGLPAIVTVCLALGVQRMSRRRAIVRRLTAVETLGCATVICADKTGTLTQNEMTVKIIDLVGREITVTGIGYCPEGEFREDGKPVDPTKDAVLRDLLLCAALCNDASLVRRGRSWEVVGDPTEGALAAMAFKGGPSLSRLARKFSRVWEIPFESERRMMAVSCSGPDGHMTFVKGAPGVVLSLCSSGVRAGRVVPSDNKFRDAVLARDSYLASQAMRVLAFACAPGNLIEIGSDGDAACAPHLTFLGLVGMMDPPRPEAARSVERARRAGIRTVMITGDHAETARAIGIELGLVDHGGGIMTGEELDRTSDRRLAEIVEHVAIFARVTPAHKLKIVRALRERGHIVAMTGDGVNDAPSIREADIGIAMGRSGTDVAREASAMVLSDDNYSTILAAIEEGRSIYDNVRKFIRYLLACNVGEVLTMLLAVAAGMPLPLTPIQILWMNLMTDGLPAMALGAEPTDPDALERPPRKPTEGVFARGLGLKIASQGVFIAACTVASFVVAGTFLGHGLATARTVAFSTLVMSQLIYVFHCRSERKPLSEIGLFSNRFLVAAVATSTALQLAAVYAPRTAAVLGTRPLAAVDWAVVLFLSGWSALLMVAARAAKRALARRHSLFRVKGAGGPAYTGRRFR
jgi:Ca2+-transporting ATPase